MSHDQVIKAYRAWRKAAEAGYGNARVTHYTDAAKTDARIRALAEKYQAILQEYHTAQQKESV